MSDYVKISDDGKTVVSGKGEARNSIGKVVPLNTNPIREASVNRVQLGEGSVQSDNSRGMRVTAGGHSDIPVENPFSDVRDQHGRRIADLRNVDAKTCSIPYGKTRVSLQVALEQNLVSVDGQGNYAMVEQKAPVQKEVTPKESIVSNANQETLNQFYQRGVSPDMMTSYINGLISYIQNDKPADGLISDFALSTGSTHESLHSWSENYLNQLMDSSLDLAVRKSNGALTGDQITEHIDRCSKSYRTQLLLSMHLGNGRAIDELISIVKARRIV